MIPQPFGMGQTNFGASLQSLRNLAGSTGYSLVGCSISGANAFFVRNDELASASGKERFIAPNDASAHFESLRLEFSRLSKGHPAVFGENTSSGGWISRDDIRD